MQLKTTTDTKQLVGRLNKRIPEIMDKTNVPGLSFALIHEAELVWAEGFGVTDTSAPKPVTPETIFEAASLSKPTFAYAALKLHESGLLDLDTPLNSYLPDTGIEADPRIDLITMRHVLSHTCGLPNWRPKGEALKIRLTPGERFSYSGEGYMLLQRVIEHLTLESGEAFMQSRLLKPLGMKNSTYLWSGESELPLAIGHDEENKPVAKMQVDSMWAAASLHSTPTDFAQLMIAIMQPLPPNQYFLRPATLNSMLTPQAPVNDSAPWQSDWPKETIVLNPQVAWGLGWGLQETSPETAFWHWGDNFCNTAFAIGYRQAGIGAVIMTNNGRGYSLYEEMCLEALGGDYPSVRWIRSLFK